MRADAARNRERILAAARDLVRTRGADLGMDDLARHAGVAVGTLYRHFPNKERLVAAVVEDSISEVEESTRAALTRAAASPGTAGDELFALFRGVADLHARDRAMKAAAAALHGSGPGAVDPTADPAVAGALALVADLLARAQQEGAVRDDVGVADLAVLLSGVPDAETSRTVYVDVVLTGLRRQEPPAR